MYKHQPSKFKIYNISVNQCHYQIIRTHNYKQWPPRHWKIFASYMATLVIWHSPKLGHPVKIWLSVILRSPYMSSSFQLTQKLLTNYPHLCLFTVLIQNQFRKLLLSCLALFRVILVVSFWVPYQSSFPNIMEFSMIYR